MALLHLTVGDHPPTVADATLEPFPGFRVIPWMSMTVEGEADADFEPVLEVTFDMAAARYRPTFIGLRADEINGTMLRTVRVTDYLKGAARLGVYLPLDEDGAEEPLAALFDFDHGQSIFGDEFTAPRDASGPTDSALAHVGFSYVFAQLAAEPPAKAVQRDLQLTARTADNWIARARKRGLLERASATDDGARQLEAWRIVMDRYQGMGSDE